MKPLRTLFLINLILYLIGSSLYPLLPLLDAQYGASPALIGVHLALLAGSNAGHGTRRATGFPFRPEDALCCAPSWAQPCYSGLPARPRSGR